VTCEKFNIALHAFSPRNAVSLYTISPTRTRYRMPLQPASCFWLAFCFSLRPWPTMEAKMGAPRTVVWNWWRC